VDCGLTGRWQEGGLRVAITVESIPAFGVLLRPVQIIRWQIEWTMANIIAGGAGWRRGGSGWVDVCGCGRGEKARRKGSLVYARPKLNQTLPGLGALSDSFLASSLAQ
jgi:hypothetical protein